MRWCKPHGLAAFSSVTVDLNEDVIINKGFWEPDDFPEMVHDKKDSLSLDPGGMLYTKHPWTDFEVDGYKFSIQRHKIPYMKKTLELAEELHPGCRTFLMHTYMAVTMTKGLFDRLYKKLEEIEKEDETFNEQMDVAITEGELNEHPNIALNIKKEMPNTSSE